MGYIQKPTDEQKVRPSFDRKNFWRVREFYEKHPEMVDI